MRAVRACARVNQQYPTNSRIWVCPSIARVSHLFSGNRGCRNRIPGCPSASNMPARTDRSSRSSASSARVGRRCEAGPVCDVTHDSIRSPPAILRGRCAVARGIRQSPAGTASRASRARWWRALAIIIYFGHTARRRPSVRRLPTFPRPHGSRAKLAAAPRATFGRDRLHERL